jgi:phospholipase C
VLTNFEKRRASRWVDRHRHELQLPVVDSERASGAEGLEQIKHIVILMMENHSYDNYFGMLEGRGDGFTLDAARRPVDPFDNKNEAGTSVGLYHPTSTVQDGGVPSQSWAASHLQYANGACDGFVTSLQKTLVTDHPEAGMAYFDEQDLPFYYSLAKTFPLASRWFCSCLGPTFPNRRFLVAGTAHGLVDDFELALLDYPPAGTIFDHLTAHGISWANYHNKPFAKTVL